MNVSSQGSVHWDRFSAAAADVDAASTLLIGAIHGQVLPRVLFTPPGSPITTPPGLARRLAETILSGIAPRGSNV
ncbi:MAG TPA: hypothetical protein VLW50_03645 [Streptosporangiaceae bacterium]|nr:hypothetical protein [Streptosporangiaceae bacterium]